MISLSHMMDYTAWADAKLLSFLQELPDEAWRAKAHDDEWHVAGLVFHIVASADWYRYQLGGTLQFTEEPQSIAEVRALGDTWREINTFLCAQATLEDETVTFTEDGETFTEQRSSVLMQAAVHSVEHRTQIVAALKAGGHADIELADYAVWGYNAAKSRP
jgi:uncharacterized damage-inducible protein DinB